MTQSPSITSISNGGGLRQVFPSGDIFLVSDDSKILEAANDYDLLAHPLEDSDTLPDGANVVLVLRNEFISRAMRKAFERMRVFVIPITSFDQSLKASLYTLRLAVCADYRSACEFNQYWATNVAHAAGPLIFEQDDATSLSCVFAAEIEANALMTPQIDVGQWVSVGSYCEFSMTAPSSSDWCGHFTINGTMAASGLLVAKDVRCTEEGEPRIRLAQELQEQLVARAPIVVHLTDGQATSIEAGGEDFTDAVRQATNPNYELHALELGLGTNVSLLPEVDWAYNSQMNEGAGAVHVGIGEGITGAHMDFVVAESSHHFTAIA